MNCKVEKTKNANEIKLEITVEAEKFENAMKKVYFKNAKYFNIPGFRKGKAPMNIVEKYYGEQIFYEDAFNEVATEAYEEAIKENKIEYLFISGDLYEHNYIRKSTIEYINNLFKEIENTKIFISPGNHDPILKKSYYNNFEWNKNVYIFNSKIQKIETEEADIYGYGFDDFYCTNSGIENLKIENPEKLNILIIHGTLNGANLEEMQYNSMSSAMIESKGFDYIALGHIHKNNFISNGKRKRFNIYCYSTNKTRS